ncbi:hypothetical protein [Methylocaldum sp.]|uniref:hypothetical protein n=1 Tax=Methylocaldum sp. TaxID=1969727 RepID=UPI002D3212DE|nr:hypothetical protein [Methylocaldum sp.]HYE35528.1 hypothetical protein [Methylocaldum sp.]
MLFQTAIDIESTLRGILEIRDNEVDVVDADKLRENCIDRLVYNAVFHESEELRYFLQWLIREAAAKLVIYPTSIQGVHEAAVRGAAPAFTTPALSLHALNYDVARACFRAARETAAGTFIFGYTDEVAGYGFQPPAEYATCILAAAIREGHQRAVFLQSDHIRIGRASYQVSRDDEIGQLKDCLEEAITAGFFNIDIDTSSLADFSRPSFVEQQQPSSRECAELVAFVREIEPEELSINIGAEIKAMGDGNLTADEFRAFMEGFFDCLNIPGGKRDLSKIIVLVSGASGEVDVDLELLREIGEIARREYGLGLAVRSGITLIPEALFPQFPGNNISELHLVAPFEDLIFDHEAFSPELKKDIYRWINSEWPGERQPGLSDDAFYRATRKRALLPFKQAMWDLPQEQRDRIMADVQAKLVSYFDTLKASNTTGLVRDTVDIEKVGLPAPVSGYSQTAETTLNALLDQMGGTRPIKIEPR